MPIEIRGRSPTSEEGRRFGLEENTWQVLQFVLHNAGVKVPTDWSRRDGAGLPDDAEAERAAERLEQYLSTHPDDRFFLDLKGRVTPPYDMSIGRQEVEGFVRFLRTSGGFEIH